MKKRIPNKGYEDEKRLVTLFGCMPVPFSGSRGLYEDGQCEHFKLQTKHKSGKGFTVSTSDMHSLQKHARPYRVPVMLHEVATEEEWMVGTSHVYVTVPLEDLEAFCEAYLQHRQTCAQERGEAVQGGMALFP